MNNPLTVKKSRCAWNFYLTCTFSLFFSGRDDADVCHSLLCLFISGSYWKIHVSSPITTFFKKFLSLWICSRRWSHASFGLFFCSIVRFWGNIFLMVDSCVKILWTVVWFKFNSLAIIRTVSRRSDRTRARTLSKLLSVFEVGCLPERGSSSALYTLN